MRPLVRLAFVCVWLVALGSCAERHLDLTDSPGFAALKGLCLESTEEMAAVPMGEGRFAVVPVSAVPRGMGAGHGYITVPAGSRFVIDEIVFVASFEGSYLFIRADLDVGGNGPVRVGLERFFSSDWRMAVVEQLDRREQVRIDADDLPIERRYVSPCKIPEDPRAWSDDSDDFVGDSDASTAPIQSTRGPEADARSG